MLEEIICFNDLIDHHLSSKGKMMFLHVIGLFVPTRACKTFTRNFLLLWHAHKGQGLTLPSTTVDFLFTERLSKMSLCKSGGLVDPGLVLTIAHDELDKRSVNRKSTTLPSTTVDFLFTERLSSSSCAMVNTSPGSTNPPEIETPLIFDGVKRPIQCV
jgi:hypothetical protein